MTKRTGNKNGRPSLYSEEMVETLLERISEGETVAAICRDPNMPSLRTVMQWAHDKPGFRTLLARAREAQTETWLQEMWEECLKADDASVRSATLRVNTRQWMMARMYPKRFSERVLAEVAKLPEPKEEEIKTVDTDYLTYEERETVRQLLLVAKSRKEGELIEQVAEGEENDEQRS